MGIFDHKIKVCRHNLFLIFNVHNCYHYPFNIVEATLLKKRAAKSKKCCKIPQTSKTPTAMIKGLAAVF